MTIEIDDSMFKASLNAVAKTDDGRVVLAYLKDTLGWEDVLMTIEDNQANVYYSTRRGVYGWLRSMVDRSELKKIEFNYKKKALTHDRGSRKHTTSTGKRTTSTTGK